MRPPADIDPKRRSGKPTLPGAPDPASVKAMKPRRVMPNPKPIEAPTEPAQGLVEALAQAIYDAEDPLSGDTIGTVIHMSEHLFWDDDIEGSTDLERQIAAVKIVCRSAAIAAIRQIDPAFLQPASDASECESCGS